MIIDFFEKWQTLIGSALGPFLAITLSVFAFFIRNKWKTRQDRKESIRRTEIAFAQTLTHINIAVTQLEEFIQRLRIILDEVEKIDNPKQYSIQGANFPATIDIHFDEELIKMKFKSYYIHNKILITDYLVKTSNGSLQQFKFDFEKLLDRNERIVTRALMPPEQQRAAFTESLKGFLEMIEKFTDALKSKYSKSIAKAKIYNLKLMKGHLHTLWKYEGRCRYFRNRKEMEKFNGNMEAVNRLDKLLESKAVELMNEIEERTEQAEREGRNM